jgi:uncharacterized protein (DUF58 family)
VRFLPSRRLLLALAAASLLVAWSSWAGFAADGALLVLFALDAGLAIRLGGPRIELRLGPRLGLGERDEVVLELTNPTGRPLEMELALDLPPALWPDAGSSGGEPDGGRQRLSLESLERTTVHFPVLARRRGRHLISTLHLRCRGPLSFSWRRSTFLWDHQVEVIPGLLEVRSYRLLALHHHLHQAGLRNVRQRGEGGAFESLREYVRGDDPRHLDWKASARHGTYIVREYEAERSQNIVLCIDTGRFMVEEVGQSERLDRALSAAVVLNEVARVWNDHVGVFAFSDQVQAVLPPGRHPPDRIPTLFATLESRPVEPDYPRALTRLSRLVSRRSLLVFFGDVIDEEVSAPLAAQLSRLARRHLPLFIAIRNSDLFRAAAAPAHDRRSAYRRAAAAELVLARARALGKMRESGIRVADVEPEEAVAAAVNRYIEIKRRGEI